MMEDKNKLFMAWLKLIMTFVWMMILSISCAIFLINIFDEENVLLIRISLAVMALSTPTLISIIKDVK